MEARKACVTFIIFAGLAIFSLAGRAKAQGQPGTVPPSGIPGGEPVRIEPSPPRIPPDFQEPLGEKQASLKKVFDARKARQEALELSSLAGEIPGDVDKVNKNILPKDLIVKLKRIEKLSKKLRTEIAE